MNNEQEFNDPGTNASPELIPENAKVLIIACGALAREVLDVIKINNFEHLAITCLPAILHNRPDEIPERLRTKIKKHKPDYKNIYVAYADCGAGGRIEKVCAEEGAIMMTGPHCYAFYTGQAEFTKLAEEEIGSFYLTDYLARHFDTLIMEGFGLNKYPEMRDMMFGNYTRLVYMTQIDDPALEVKAKAAAAKLKLNYVKIKTGYGELAQFIEEAAK